MKKFYALIALVFTLVACSTPQGATSSADKKAARDQERDKQKAEEEVYDEATFQIAVQALNAHEFVLEADQLISRRGMSAFVNTTTNFVMMNKDRATVQIASNGMIAGPNGVGGITVDGMVSDVKLKTSKKGDIDFSFNVQGVGISAQVLISMSNGSNEASATVYPNFNSNNITLNGNIVTLGESSVFKGRSF